MIDSDDNPMAVPDGLFLSVSQFQNIMDERLPFAQMMGMQVDYFRADHVQLRAVYSDRFLRPGGTIAGPVMMGLADAALYALVLSRIGLVELAVTTQLSINFLRRPGPCDVIAVARMLKLGKRLAIGEVSLFSEQDDHGEPVAHATGTYSIPPPDKR